MNWRERWRAWREEFYSDNPIAWYIGALAWVLGINTHKQRPAPEHPWQMIPLWRINPHEYFFLPIVNLLPLLFVLFVLRDYSTTAALLQQSNIRTPFLGLAFLSVSILANFVAVEGDLNAVLSPKGALYAGLTRLQGSHVVFGILSISLLRTVRTVCLYHMTPWFALGVLFSGSVAYGLWYALLMMVITSMYRMFWAVFAINSATVEYQKRVGWRVPRLIPAFLIAFVFWAPTILIFWVDMPTKLPASVLEWVRSPWWWLSFSPLALAATSLWIEFHPLWGVPQIGLWVGLVWWYAQRTATRLNEFRCVRETLDSSGRQEVPGEWG